MDAVGRPRRLVDRPDRSVSSAAGTHELPLAGTAHRRRGSCCRTVLGPRLVSRQPGSRRRRSAQRRVRPLRADHRPRTVIVRAEPGRIPPPTTVRRVTGGSRRSGAVAPPAHPSVSLLGICFRFAAHLQRTVTLWREVLPGAHADQASGAALSAARGAPELPPGAPAPPERRKVRTSPFDAENRLDDPLDRGWKDVSKGAPGESVRFSRRRDPES